ncbi:hypothetical protein HA466_0044070 [Hirschfeldia incana]|nr:hypothetical protein HA466_0044070 [Hirschfeldia incana]
MSATIPYNSNDTLLFLSAWMSSVESDSHTIRWIPLSVASFNALRIAIPSPIRAEPTAASATEPEEELCRCFIIQPSPAICVVTCHAASDLRRAQFSGGSTRGGGFGFGFKILS